MARKPRPLTYIFRHSRFISSKITSLGFINLCKLSSTVHTNIVLFSFFMTIFIDMTVFSSSLPVLSPLPAA
uniref:Similarity Hypothetical start n=1 Tax=Microcystis aeruginosa (strain PCC 7806) TaxID=267872 RepID=A8YBB8_MICA7|nr:unnamed protein product [Microcystis aeruginosa PCC 7806]